jgi:Cu2+-exporting ATPase
MVGNGKGAKNGILFKTASSLELAGRTQIVALDKTGTITKGEPEVTDVIGDEELLKTAFSLEIKSEHPLAKAIVDFGKKSDISALETTDFRIFTGGGLTASINGATVCAGNREFVAKYCKDKTKRTTK